MQSDVHSARYSRRKIVYFSRLLSSAPDGNMHIPKGESPKGKRKHGGIHHEKHLINFPEDNISIESFYDRLRPCYDSIMQFGDRVLVAQMNWNGMLEGAVYGFVEDPEEGWSPIECRLELLKISDETYTDAGHAIEWCIKNAH